MSTITVTHEDNEVDEFEFDDATPVITIGRRSSNDVCIPNLSVSGLHARITVDGSSALIEDLNSTNGTYINGRLISRQLLDVGDEIIIGKTHVSISLDKQTQDNASGQDAYRAEMASQSAAVAAAKAATSESVARNDVPHARPQAELATSFDGDDSFVEDLPEQSDMDDVDDERPMSLSQKAKLALGREAGPRQLHRAALNNQQNPAPIDDQPQTELEPSVSAGEYAMDDADITEVASQPARQTDEPPHPLDGLDEPGAQQLTHELDKPASSPTGAVIEIQNGAKSGQVLPIDKPVTTLGRPGIQIAAIMRKPDGYFVMHIESDDSVDRPTLNQDSIGDDPVLLHSGDKLNVAGIDVEFMLS